MNTTPPHEDLFRIALSHPAVVLANLLARQHEAKLYLVGGAVRDLLLTGRLPHDLDFAVIGVSAEVFSRAMADQMQGHYVLLDAEFGIHRVVIQKDDAPDLTLDIADALLGDIERDLQRRDLTVNAMAIGLDNTFWDPFEGLEDLNRLQIRMVNEANLVDDPLRMLRVFRFVAQLNATRMDDATLKAVQTHANHIEQTAAERIHYEFLRMLSYPGAFQALQAMGDSGLLEILLPELKATRDVPPNDHHHLMLYDHTLELVNQAEQWIQKLPEKAQDHLAANLTPFCNRAAIVKLACLLHDIGKPDTMEIREEDGRHTFYGHDKVSEEMTDEIAKRWKLSKDLTAGVKKLVRWHLYPCQFGPDSPRKSILKFLRRMGEDTPDVILLALADRHSTLGPKITPEVLEKSTADHLWLLDQFYVERETLRLPRLLDGREVMDLLKLEPGPRVGEVMEALQEAHQLGEVTTSEAARQWLVETYG